MDRLAKISQTLHDIAKTLGAVSSGIVSKESLDGGPPSADLSYVLPNAKSAFCFALALDQKNIEAFLQKKDRYSHDQDNVHANTYNARYGQFIQEQLGQLA